MNYAKEIRYEDPNALEKILQKRQFLIDQHHKMIQANKAHIILRVAFTNEEILELAQRIVSSDGKPYSDEELSQNKAARQRIGQSLEIFKKRQAIANKTHEFKGGTATFDSMRNKVRIRLNEPAGFKFKAALAEHGFQYFQRTKTWDRWFGDGADEAWEAALKIVMEWF